MTDDQPTADSTAVPPPGAGAPAPDVLTQDDDGRTILMGRGEEVPLRLDGAWVWEEPVVGGGAVELSPVNYFDDPGFVEWAVAAVAPGTSTLRVTGDPYCGDSSVCPPVTVSISFRVG